MSTQAPSLPKPTLPGPMPAFIQANPSAIQQTAQQFDTTAYGLSDADFRQRYPELYASQNTFMNNLNTQMSGNITPQLQNLWSRSGLTNALQSTGNWSLGTGTAGMANIARNLGINQMGYQQNLLNQFQTANQTFLPRTFGLSGADAANIALNNIAGQNNQNAQAYAYQVQESQFAANMAAQQSMASANAANAQTANIVGGAGSAVSALAVVAFCWVARSVYGASNPRWKRHRYYMLTKAPKAFQMLYKRFGPALAAYLEAHRFLKPAVRALMELATYGLQYEILPI